MKKYLAFLLVLVMILSVSLVACKKNAEEPSDDDDDGWGNGGGTTTESIAGDDNKDDNKGENNTPSTNTWADKVDTIYTGVNNLNLRIEANANAAIVKTVAAAGTALNRVATNGTWDKIEIGEGEAKQTAYVLHSLVSLVGTNFAFTDLAEAVTLTIVGDSKINLRSTPFVPDGDYAYSNVTIQECQAIYGGTLKKLAVSNSGTWYKVSYVGTIGEKTYNGTEVLYMAASSVSAGYVLDPSVSNSGNGGTLG